MGGEQSSSSAVYRERKMGKGLRWRKHRVHRIDGVHNGGSKDEKGSDTVIDDEHEHTIKHILS